MKKRVRATTATLVLAACAATPVAQADILAFTTTGGSVLGTSGATAGYTFSLANSVNVTQLGVWDFGANGLTAAIMVTIWDGNGASQTTATVPAGTGTELNSYLYITLTTPVTLAAGAYTIGAYYPSSVDRFQFGTTPTGAAGVTFGAPRFIVSNSYPATDALGSSGGNYFGPNFQFTATVPEPSAWAMLLATGSVLAVAWRQASPRVPTACK